MHAVVMESLEEYLSGSLNPDARRAVEAHLSSCAECGQEVYAMQDLSQLIVTLRTEEPLEPVPGFAARVMEVVGARRAPSFASLFSLDFAFGRRVVFASLITLAVLGSYLVSRESGYNSGPTPETVIAQDDNPAPNGPSGEQARMLVTLATYHDR